MSDPTSQRLADIEAIKQLKAKYALFLDSQNWDALRTLFSEDCVVLSTNSPLASVDGQQMAAKEWIDAAAEGIGGQLRLHMLHSPLIELTSPTTARALWPMSSSALRGYYRDEYLCIDGEWKFSSVQINILVQHDAPRLAREVDGSAGSMGTLERLAKEWAPVKIGGLG